MQINLKIMQLKYKNYLKNQINKLNIYIYYNKMDNYIIIHKLHKYYKKLSDLDILNNNYDIKSKLYNQKILYYYHIIGGGKKESKSKSKGKSILNTLFKHKKKTGSTDSKGSTGSKDSKDSKGSTDSKDSKDSKGSTDSKDFIQFVETGNSIICYVNEDLNLRSTDCPLSYKEGDNNKIIEVEIKITSYQKGKKDFPKEKLKLKLNDVFKYTYIKECNKDKFPRCKDDEITEYIKITQFIIKTENNKKKLLFLYDYYDANTPDGDSIEIRTRGTPKSIYFILRDNVELVHVDKIETVKKNFGED